MNPILNFFSKRFHCHSRVESNSAMFALWSLHSNKTFPMFRVDASIMPGNINTHLAVGEDEAQVSFYISAYFASLSIQFNYLPIHWLTREYNRYVFNFGLWGFDFKECINSEPVLNLEIWSPAMGADYGAKPFMHLYLDILRPIFGPIQRTIHTEIEKDEVIKLAHPNGEEIDTYPATLKIERVTWKRSRWFLPTSIIRAKLSNSEGIPNGEFRHGEPDANYAHLFPITWGDQIPEDAEQFALDKYVADIQQSRINGGYYD